MIPHTNQLNEVVVYANNPRTIIEKAMEKIPVNYSANRNMLTCFYRETVQKGRRYISVSEAVLDVSKTAYTNRTTDDDKLQVLKGRRLLSQKASDTLAVKVMGGPNISVVLDIVKNKEALLELEELNNYEFWMSESALIDNRIQYVINFRPRVLLPYALFHGKLYVDCDNLSFTRVEMDLDMQNKSKAIAAILHQKPLGLRFKPQELSFLITYKTIDGRTYMNYIRNDIRFKCDWKRRLFSTNYAVTSEMVVTDRRENPSEMIPRNKVFASNQIFYDKVGNYWSEDFWGNYNIIEPTESLEHAVDKLKSNLIKIRIVFLYLGTIVNDSSMLNELLILTKIKAGDIKAFEELFRCYYSPLCWYAASITGRIEVAEEIVEELFYVLWKDREQLQIFNL